MESIILTLPPCALNDSQVAEKVSCAGLEIKERDGQQRAVTNAKASDQCKRIRVLGECPVGIDRDGNVLTIRTSLSGQGKPAAMAAL